jgi:hypothetical protein
MIALSQIEPISCTRQSLVRAYVLMLVEGKRPPPVKLIKQDRRYPYFIYDGHHRVAAARSIKRKVIKAEIVPMPGARRMTQTNGHVDPAAWAELNRVATRAAIVDGVSFRGWTKDEVQVFLKTIGRFVTDQTRPLRDEIAKLKARVAELEECGTKFCGTWQRANAYKRGEWVGFDGSGWVALGDVAPLEQPGTSDKWQLVIRAGRDARDQRLPTKGGARAETIVQRRT